MLHVLLPIGISFYTFNSMSYTIDVYRRRVRPTRTHPRVRGVRRAVPAPHRRPDRSLHRHRGRSCAARPPADARGSRRPGCSSSAAGSRRSSSSPIGSHPIVDPLFARARPIWVSLGAWAAALGYALQLYFDFSGYSDMAVGLACLLGFRFPQNFNSPLKAREHLRLLAALAHDPVVVAARLPLHPARRIAEGNQAHCRRPGSDDGPRWTVARRRPHLRRVGGRPGNTARRPRDPA